MTKNFNRIAYVQIAIGDSSKVFTSDDIKLMYKDLKWETIRGLDIKFDITRPIFSTVSEAHIAILGLSMKKIEKYATWGAEATAWKKIVFVRLYAGYGESEEDARLIFEGNVITAMPTMPPDVWLEIQARNLFFFNGLVMTEYLSETTDVPDTMPLDEYIGLVCDSMGVKYNLDSISNDVKTKIISPPVYQNPESAILSKVLKDVRKLCKANKIIFYLENDNEGSTVIIFEPLKHPKDFQPSKNSIVKIDKDTGMIGIPKIKFNQIEVTCLLNENATNRLLMYADVTSRFAFPGMFNNYGEQTSDLYHAIYKIINIKFHGHLRGNEWYATYTALRDWREGE